MNNSLYTELLTDVDASWRGHLRKCSRVLSICRYLADHGQRKVYDSKS